MLIRTQETLAATDPLTGIPNRRAFLERVAAAVDAAAWGHQTVVCLVDLDGFKAVNDAGGHAAGDAMLKAVGAALGGAVRETDTVARLGGDEFAVLADVSVAFSGEMLAERLRQAVAAVGAASGVTASVGVAEVEPGDDVEDLMHRADAAMYRSKSAGGNRVTALRLLTRHDRLILRAEGARAWRHGAQRHHPRHRRPLGRRPDMARSSRRRTSPAAAGRTPPWCSTAPWPAAVSGPARSSRSSGPSRGRAACRSGRSGSFRGRTSRRPSGDEPDGCGDHAAQRRPLLWVIGA